MPAAEDTSLGRRPEVCDLGAAEQARLVAGRQVSPVELVEASLTRIEQVQPKLNAFCFTYPDEALAQAKRAEAAVMRGDALGPLHGLPIAIKDFTPTNGKTTTRGSIAFKDWVPDWDPVIVKRLRASGAILVGKTTTPEFAFSSFTRSPLWGDTLNPWDTSRTPGGSSGGSAAAVATGCVALAEGTDMGGSVRIPAALCGIVGHKPSLGRIPMDILPTVFDSISHFGPLARSVGDAALMLRAVEGPDEADIQSQVRPLPWPDQPLSDVKGLTLALSADLGFYKVEPEVEGNLRAVALALQEAGATIREVKLAWTPEIVDAWTATWGVLLAACFGDLLAERREDLDPEVVALMEAGLSLDAVAYKKLEEVRTRQWQALAPILADCDALLCPTMARVAPRADRSDADFESLDEEGRLLGLDMTSPFNSLAPLPALSVPSGFGADGLPTAVQIVSRRYDDPLAFRIGAAIEAMLAPNGFPRPPL